MQEVIIPGINRLREKPYSYEVGNLSIRENAEEKLEITLCGIDIGKEFLPPGWVIEKGSEHEAKSDRIIVSTADEALGSRIFSIFHEIGHVIEDRDGGRAAAKGILDSYEKRRKERGVGTAFPEVTDDYAGRFVNDMKKAVVLTEKSERMASINAFRNLRALAIKSGKDPRVGVRDADKDIVGRAVGAYTSYEGTAKRWIRQLSEGPLPEKYVTEFESYVSKIFEGGKVEIKKAGEALVYDLSMEFDPPESMLSQFLRPLLGTTKGRR